MILRSILIYSLFAVCAVCQDKNTDEPPFAQPPVLRLKIDDSFDTDSRKAYKLGGKQNAVAWETGKLLLNPGSVVEKDIHSGSWAEFSLELDFPQLVENEQTSELKVWFDLNHASDCFIWGNNQTWYTNKKAKFLMFLPARPQCPTRRLI